MNFDDLTLGEVEEIEMLLGRGIDEIFSDGNPKGRALRVLYYIIKRKENPEYTFEETEKVSQADALKLLGGNDPKGKN